MGENWLSHQKTKKTIMTAQNHFIATNLSHLWQHKLCKKIHLLGKYPKFSLSSALFLLQLKKQLKTMRMLALTIMILLNGDSVPWLVTVQLLFKKSSQSLHLLLGAQVWQLQHHTLNLLMIHLKPHSSSLDALFSMFAHHCPPLSPDYSLFSLQ